MGEDELDDYNDAVWAKAQDEERQMLLEDPGHTDFLDNMEE